MNHSFRKEGTCIQFCANASLHFNTSQYFSAAIEIDRSLGAKWINDHEIISMNDKNNKFLLMHSSQDLHKVFLLKERLGGKHRQVIL